MNEPSRTSCLLAFALLSALPSLARGQAAPRVDSPALTEAAAVERAVANNPTLHVALLQVEQARADVRAEEGLYSPIFSANAGYTRLRQPGLRGDGVAISTTETLDLGTGIRKPFPWGTVVALDVSGQRSVRSSPGQTTTIDGAVVNVDGEVGPAYGVAAQLTLTQPLLRGAGRDVGLATLRSARLRSTAAALAARDTASALLRDVLRAYWELWYADQVVRINEASRELSREQNRQAELQVASGAIANIDALTYTTRLAELEEAVVLAVTDRRQRSLGLGLLVGQTGRAPGLDLRAADAPPERRGESVEPPAALEEALKASPQLRRLETQIAIARDQYQLAGDPLRPRLDLDASLQVQGLGNREIPPAFEQLGAFEAVSTHVGLTFEVPVDATRRRSQIESARLAEHIARKELEVARQSLSNDVFSSAASRAAAEQRVAVASQTVRVAGAQVEAERGRFAAGISVAIQVQQAEDSFRQAQLRLERARVDAALAEIELLHLRGRLLELHASALSRLPVAAPSLTSLPRSNL